MVTFSSRDDRKLLRAAEVAFLRKSRESRGVASKRTTGRDAIERNAKRMTTSLDGTVALVTGASSGIGEATARALAAEGAAVALAARRRDRLEVLADKIRGEGGTVLVLEADITEEDQARGVVAQTVAELGRLDTLVNNAGLM